MKVTIRRSVLRDTIAWLHEHREQFKWSTWVSVPGMLFADAPKAADDIMNCGSQCCIAGYIALNYARSIDGLIDCAGDVYKDAHLVNTPDICAIGLITGLDPNDDDFDSPSHVPSELTDLFGYFLFFPWQSNAFYLPWEYNKGDEDQDITEAIKRLEWLLDEKDPFLYNSDEDTRDDFLDNYGCTFEFEYVD